MRRGIAATAAVLLVLEAFGLALINWVLGLAVRHQSMSLAGLDPTGMAVGAWVAGGLLALFLIGCGVVLGRAVWHDRPLRRFGRVLLVGCAVLHGVLGAAVVGLVGWPAFGVMMLIFGFVVWSLLLYGDEGRPERPEPPVFPQPKGGAPAPA
jgi:MFS family permease